jgi:hypothetical protein
MNSKDPAAETPAPPAHTLVTLKPLDKGQAAIPPDPANHVATVRLSQLELVSFAAIPKTTIIKADDVMATVPPGGALVPQDCDPVAATFSYQLSGATAPHTVEVRPPNTIRLQQPGDAPSICPWLFSTGFALVVNLAEIGVLCLLALAALSPLPDDDDDDPDDDDHHPAAHTFT